jgi:hypothetical protein
MYPTRQPSRAEVELRAPVRFRPGHFFAASCTRSTKRATPRASRNRMRSEVDLFDFGARTQAR